MCPPWPYTTGELLKMALLARYVIENPWPLPDLPDFDVESWFGADQLSRAEENTEVWEPGELP